MHGAYRSQPYSSLERKALALSCKRRGAHDALELAAECQTLLEDAGFLPLLMTHDTTVIDTKKLWPYQYMQELYYQSGDALAVISYTAYSPFSERPATTACAYLQPAAESIGKLAGIKTHAQAPSTFIDMAICAFQRTRVLRDVMLEIRRRAIVDFEDALLHTVRFSAQTASGEAK